MKLTHLKLFTLTKASALALPVLMALMVTACAQQGSHIIVAPQINSPSIVNYQGQQAHLSVSDMRIATHIIEISREDKAKELFSSQRQLDGIVSLLLTKQFSQQGLRLNDMAVNSLAVIIDSASIKVNQQTLKYQSQSEIVLRVIVTTPQQTLTKTFTQKGDSYGVLQADIAVLERDFNQHFASLLQQILTNAEIKLYLRGTNP